MDEARRTEMTAAHPSLLRKSQELEFDEAAEARWQESRSSEVDMITVNVFTGVSR